MTRPLPRRVGVSPPTPAEPHPSPVAEVRRAGDLVTVTVCHCTLAMTPEQARALAAALHQAAS